jgi:hypothetical protein
LKDETEPASSADRQVIAARPESRMLARLTPSRERVVAVIPLRGNVRDSARRAFDRERPLGGEE